METIKISELPLGTLEGSEELPFVDSDGVTKRGNVSSKANDSDVVHKTGDEPISGVKTFYSSPIIPTPTTDTQASTKAYSDSLNPDFYQYSIVRSVGNLCVNNSFETDLSGWSTYGGASNTRVTSESYHGGASMRIITTGGAQGTQQNFTGLIPGIRYVFSVYAKGSVGGENFNIYCQTPNNEQLDFTLTNSWARYEVSFLATGTDHTIFSRNMSGSATTFFIDAVQLEAGTTTAGPFTTTQGNLTVALKNYEGNDPTPTKPVKIMIGGVVRTITSALGMTLKAGVNWLNAGSSELATKEIDYFAYLRWDSGSSSVRLDMSRFPSFTSITATEANGYALEKGLVVTGDSGSGYPHTTVNIGRFNAILSAGPGYTWSLPATSVIVNRPIYETRWLSANLVAKGSSGSAGVYAQDNVVAEYKIAGDSCYIKHFGRITNVGSWSGTLTTTFPFTAVQTKWQQNFGRLQSQGGLTTKAVVNLALNGTNWTNDYAISDYLYSNVSTNDWYAIEGVYKI